MSEPAGRYSIGAWPVSRLLLIVAFVLAMIATLDAAGVMSVWNAWAFPAGVAAFILAFLL